MIGILAVSLFALQGAFDAGDRKKAYARVAEMKLGPDGGTALDKLTALNGGTPPACKAEIQSGCQGRIRVACLVGSDSQPYTFDVDLIGEAARPADPRTAERMGMAPATPTR
jgi:hypothetical protein